MDEKAPMAKAPSVVLGEIPPVHRMDNIRADVLSRRWKTRQKFPEHHLHSQEAVVSNQQAMRPFGISRKFQCLGHAVFFATLFIVIIPLTTHVSRMREEPKSNIYLDRKSTRLNSSHANISYA